MPFTANEALLIDGKFFGLICFVVAVSYVNVQLKNISAISREKITFYILCNIKDKIKKPYLTSLIM